MTDNEKRTENARERTVYIEGRPVWAIENNEVKPNDPKTKESILEECFFSFCEAVKAFGRSLAKSAASFGRLCSVAAEYVAEKNAIEKHGNPKDLHYYKHCKKLRVRKKYKNRLLKEVRAKMKEADE